MINKQTDRGKDTHPRIRILISDIINILYHFLNIPLKYNILIQDGKLLIINILVALLLAFSGLATIENF